MHLLVPNIPFDFFSLMSKISHFEVQGQKSKKLEKVRGMLGFYPFLIEGLFFAALKIPKEAHNTLFLLIHFLKS